MFVKVLPRAENNTDVFVDRRLDNIAGGDKVGLFSHSIQDDLDIISDIMMILIFRITLLIFRITLSSWVWILWNQVDFTTFWVPVGSLAWMM